MEEVLDDFIAKFYTQDRIVALEKLAEEEQWGFTRRARFAEQPTDIKTFRIFQGKRGKRVLGILEPPVSESGYALRVYDYVYYSDGGKKKTTVIEIHLSELFLSQFRIYPKPGIKTLFSLGGRTDDPIDQFNKHYEIEASDPDTTNMELPDSVLTLLGERKGYSLEGEGQYLVLYRKSKQMPANEILAARELAIVIADAVMFDREKDFV